MSAPWNPLAWAGVPTSFLPSWPGPEASVPQALDQPILPGWIFGSVINVTEENSAAPAAEAAILRKYSYGRQLGQIADALQVLIDERADEGGPLNHALEKFVAMRANVDNTKAHTATSRINQVRTDLRALKQQDPDEYERVRAELLKTLQ